VMTCTQNTSERCFHLVETSDIFHCSATCKNKDWECETT